MYEMIDIFIIKIRIKIIIKKNGIAEWIELKDKRGKDNVDKEKWDKLYEYFNNHINPLILYKSKHNSR